MISIGVEDACDGPRTSTAAVDWRPDDAIQTFHLIIFTVAWSILLSFIPFFVEFDSTAHMYEKDGWYGLADIIRFIEPVGGMPLNMAILMWSGFLVKANAQVILTVFTFSGTIYVQGAAFHSASVMFKNAVEKYDEMYDGNRYITDMLYWIRTIWQHIISHYLYACGYAVFVVCIVWVYKDHEVQIKQDIGATRRLCASITIAAILYAILLVGVAINFPSGTIVGFLYFIIYGLGFHYYLLLKSSAWEILTTGDLRLHSTWRDFIFKRPVVFYYLAGHTLAFVILICWIISVGGFYSQSEAA